MTNVERNTVLVASTLVRDKGRRRSFWKLRGGYVLPSVTLDRAYMIHAAQWSHTPVELEGQVKRTLLVFVSVFSEDTSDYISTFAKQLKTRVDLAFGGADDWRPVTSSGRLIDYVERHEHKDRFFYSAYPDSSVTDVVGAVRASRRTEIKAAKQQSRGPQRRTTLWPKTSYALSSWRLAGWRSTTFVFPCDGTDEGRFPALHWQMKRFFEELSGIHFASFTFIETVHDAGEARSLARPYLIVSVQHDGWQRTLVERLTSKREQLSPLLGFTRGFAEATDSSDFEAFLRKHRAKSALTVKGYRRQRLENVTAAIKKREVATQGIVRRAADGSRATFRTVAQGNILEGYSTGYLHGAYVFLEVPEACAVAARGWLRVLVDEITSAEMRPTKPTTLNVGLSYPGLLHLGVDATNLTWCSDAFREGMAARAVKELGDSGDSDPALWHHPKDRRADVFVAIRAKQVGQLTERLAAIVDSAGDAGLRVIGPIERGRLIVDRPSGPRHIREPFGFRDGISQPRIAHGRMTEDPLAIKLGEFLFGHRDEDGRMTPGEGLDILTREGSYLVYRKLHQHIDVFHNFLDDHATEEVSHDELAASLVGRTWDGDVPPALKRRDGTISYRKDPKGVLCPIGAHIRRVNPGDSLDRHGTRSRRHRLLRRGIPYLDTRTSEPAGLLFMAHCTHLERQFEFVQRVWLNDGNVFGLVDQPDVFAGQQKGVVLRAKPAVNIRLKEFVTTRDGEYFFVPSVKAIKKIAEGAFA